MFESMVQAPESDIIWSAHLRSYLKIYFYVAFFFQTITFALIFYLIHFRTPATMIEYRRLLQVNIISAYCAELSFILWIPVILPTNYHVLSDGLIGKFGPQTQYYWIFVLTVFMTSHVIAIIGCILYQISMISIIKMHFIRASLEFILSNNLYFHLFYIALTAVISISFISYTWINVQVDFQPTQSLDLLIAQDKLVYECYLKNSTNAIYIDISQTGFVLKIYTLLMVCFKSILLL